MLNAMRQAILFSNSTHECENATRSNTLHLNDTFGLKAYKVGMICLPLLNCLLNGVCCWVFRRMKPGNQFNRILTYLSAVEVLFQATFAFHQLMFYLMETNQLILPSLLAAEIVAGAIVLSIVLLTAFHLLRNWMVVLISYYRYCSASVPSHASCFFTGHLRLKGCCLVALCLIVALPRSLEFSIVVCSISRQVTHIDGNLSENTHYRMLYIGAILFLAQNVGPVMLLLCFSVCLCHIMYRQRRSRAALLQTSHAQNHQHHHHDLHPNQQQLQQHQHLRHNRHRRQQQSGTQLVIVLCAVFLFCEAPTLLKVIDPMRTRLHLLGYTTNLLTCVDSTLNILVYYLSNREFSGALRRRIPWLQGDSRQRSESREHCPNQAYPEHRQETPLMEHAIMATDCPHAGKPNETNV